MDSVTININSLSREDRIADRLLELGLHPKEFDLGKFELGSIPLNPYNFGPRYQRDLTGLDWQLATAPVRLGK